MSAEQIREFLNGLAEFRHNGVTFNTLKTNFENAVNNIPADLHSPELTNAAFKRHILR